MADYSRRDVNEEYTVDSDFQVVGDSVVVTDSIPTTGYSEEQPNLFGALLRELFETVVLSLILLPNFHEGQFVLMNKLAFKLGEPHRGEVLVFHNTDLPSEDFIKRIIGLPGDSVEVHGKQVFVNGKLLPEPFNHNVPDDNYAFGPVTVEDNTLFVMGDNRPNSKDSRVIGSIPEDLLVGKAWLRVWPLNEFGFIKHYQLEPGQPESGQ